MNNSKALKAVIAVLVVALFTSFGFLFWRDFWWKQEVYRLADYEGGMRALNDFHVGKMRLFIIAGERSEDKYSGTNDGPFEVWFTQYSTEPFAFRYSTEQFVYFYNDNMRYMHEHPDKFLTTTNR